MTLSFKTYLLQMNYQRRVEKGDLQGCSFKACHPQSPLQTSPSLTRTRIATYAKFKSLHFNWLTEPSLLLVRWYLVLKALVTSNLADVARENLIVLHSFPDPGFPKTKWAQQTVRPEQAYQSLKMMMVMLKPVWHK